ncbi:MAG TPA: hypothetical protein VFT43_04165, partial [Candidatus Polarisedimenticolia bacterium]|nr:hypothetical protein [Candidatus Polarisedimenticolia bacterium]
AVAGTRQGVRTRPASRGTDGTPPDVAARAQAPRTPIERPAAPSPRATHGDLLEELLRQVDLEERGHLDRAATGKRLPPPAASGRALGAPPGAAGARPAAPGILGMA